MAEVESYGHVTTESLAAVVASAGGTVPMAVSDLITELVKTAKSGGRELDWATLEIGSCHAHEVPGLDAMSDYEPDALIIRASAHSLPAAE